MASMMQAFSRVLKTLRENSTIKEKREALTYIRSFSKKLESSGTIKEEVYKELCKLVAKAFLNGDNDIQQEACETLNVILHDFKNHNLNFFESLSQTNQKHRLKILKLIEKTDDSAIALAANDDSTLKFFTECMTSVDHNKMKWLSPSSTENVQMLKEMENQTLSEERKLEEEIVNQAVIVLQRLYKIAAATMDSKIQRFDVLLMDKVVSLAYMGHKRQRDSALKLLEQAVITNLPAHIRREFSNTWTIYKTNLQSVYYKRMLLLAEACDPDWSKQWNISIQFLGTDLHRGSVLINNLLSVEERAFKSTDTVIRRQAFMSWKLLIDNFALNPAELATTRRIKLLCIPLNAKNSKTELIALTKLEVWWHLIMKLYKDITQFANPVIVQFLNFSFGPLGDTPLLSSKCDVVASPGKRFFKTKLAALDAMYQLLVAKQDTQNTFPPVLEERLPHAMSDAIFQECHQSIIHSVGEAFLILNQLTDKELKDRYDLGKLLWTSLLNYIHKSKVELKTPLCKNMVVVITELGSYATEDTIIKDLILDVFLTDLIALIKDTDYNDITLLELILKLLTTTLLNDMKTRHCQAIECLLCQYIKPKKAIVYHADTLQVFNTIMEKMKVLGADCANMSMLSELWCTLAQVLTNFMEDSQDINEGNAAEHNFKTVTRVSSFPFMYIVLDDMDMVLETAKVWKSLYKQFDMRADLIATVKPNEILLDTANTMKFCYNKNSKCTPLIVCCLDALLTTINYKYLLDEGDTSVIQLVVDLTLSSFANEQIFLCDTILKVLSALLITVYGLDPKRVVSYLEISKPAIELMLVSDSEALIKEVINTWETVTSIFRGLNKLLSHDLLTSYKYTFIRAISHPNSDIETQALSVLEVADNLEDNAKRVLEEVFAEVKENTGSIRSPRVTSDTEKSKKTIAQVKASGSFLNRKIGSPKPGTNKQQAKIEKKPVLPPDPSSQDYVFIKTDVKFDVNRLTEHQKESFKRRRDDIPALYNDLSQSCSQDSQQLQEMFNKKVHSVNKVNVENDKVEKDDVDREVSKEKNIDTAGPSNDEVSETQETNFSPVEKCPNKDIEPDNNVMATDNLPKEPTVAVNLPPATGSLSPENIGVESETVPVESIVKKLNFESQEEFPQDKEPGRLSPSILDSNKRRDRNVLETRIVDGKQEKTSDKQNEQGASSTVSKTLRRKARERKQSDDVLSNENRRGIKRKSASDSDSEGSVLPRRRKKLNTASTETHSDSDTVKSSENEGTPSTRVLDSIAEEKSLSQRTKNEISRLRIDMVFDCQIPNRRRSKTDSAGKSQEPTDGKGTKLKPLDKKVGEVGRRRLKSAEKEIDTTPTSKKQRRRSSKADVTKTAENNEESKGNTEGKTAVPDEKSSQTSEDAQEISDVGSPLGSKEDDQNLPTVNEIENDNMESKMPETESLPVDIPMEVPEIIASSQDEDIVESSQQYVTAKLDKRCSEKQCFIKIDKLESNLLKPLESPVERDTVIKNTEMDVDNIEKIDVQEAGASTVIKQVNTEQDQEDEIVVEKTAVPESDNALIETANISEIEKIVVVDDQKSDNNSVKASTMSLFSSPKTNAKRLSRPKTFPNQGRGAHMLGLVTKQALNECDGQGPRIDDEVSSKKTKSKELDYEPLAIRKEKTSNQKESETVVRGTACSSRQEKIFSNMRSADYPLSSSVKLFSNLKNDGEKISPKMDRHVSETVTSYGGERENDGNVSPTCEREELPILEWSSANPPSLTASPSAGILKRHRSAPEPETDCTTPKRKRVSFADPPVSKEMGYEIVTSPLKISKYFVRGSPFRKDSPLRLKQSKWKMIQVDSEKVEKEETLEAVNLSEVQLQCERDNQILSKIAEELEYPEPAITEDDGHLPTISSVAEDNDVTPAQGTKVTVSNISNEMEIVVDLTDDGEQGNPVSFTEEVKEENTQDTETQQDIFSDDGVKEDALIPDIEMINEKKENADRPNVSMDSPKLNSSDSVLDNLSKTDSKTTDLEDTVDVANITGLNSTASSDEGFCKPIRSSTQETENVVEIQDIIGPDAGFASQDTQNVSQVNAEISKPELLDSTISICPQLVPCQEPISTIVVNLTNPLWVQHLTTYFSDRGIQTVGDLARLSEREVERIPVKGSPKSEFVKKVLRRFEFAQPTGAATSTSATEKSLDTSADKSNLSGLASASTVTIFSISEQGQTMAEAVQTNSLTCSTPRTQTKTSKELIADLAAATTVSVAALNETTASTEADDSAGTPFMATESLQGQPTEMTATSSVSASRMDCSTTTTNRPVQRPLSSSTSRYSTEAANDKELLAVNESFPNPAMQTTVSIGTDTDFISSSKITISKSVESQMALEELLDEIDVNLVLDSATRRCTPESILTRFKQKVKYITEAELVRETIRMLGVGNKSNYNEITLKAACRACGINKVLLRLPDIFGGEKDFFTKVLNAYGKKIKAIDYVNLADMDELKEAVCRKCTAADLAEMLSKTLKEEEKNGIQTPMTELCSLNAMLKRLPTDVIISHTVANDELVPSNVVLDIALQNNSLHNIVEALAAQPPIVRKTVFDKLWSPQYAASQIETESVPKEDLLEIFKAVSSKLSERDLLDAYASSMKAKLDEKMEETQENFLP